MPNYKVNKDDKQNAKHSLIQILTNTDNKSFFFSSVLKIIKTDNQRTVSVLKVPKIDNRSFGLQV